MTTPETHRLQSLGQRLRHDQDHQRLSAALGHLPHVILKGPSTSDLLHDELRTSNDIDVLVPASRRQEAVDLLLTTGVAAEVVSELGEEGAHAQVLLSQRGYPIDVHVTLPMLVPDGDRPWMVLEPHLMDLGWDLGRLPVLDLAGRRLVLALHAMGTGSTGRALEELQAARSADSDWSGARSLAAAVGALEEYEAGLALLSPGGPRPVSLAARMAQSRAPGAALRLAQISTLPRTRWAAELWREAFPSQAFMRSKYSVEPGVPMMTAYLARLLHQARQLRSAVRALRA